MKLSSITIKNFKNIDEHGITVDIAPITLLFGPNNAGKSTIIQALYLAREILTTPEVDFDNIKIDEKSINLGKFVNYIHKHDLSKSIIIKLNYEIEDSSIFGEDFYGKEKIQLLTLIKNLAIEFEISWDYNKKIALLKSYTLFVNGKILTKASIIPNYEENKSEIKASFFELATLINIDEVFQDFSQASIPSHYGDLEPDLFFKFVNKYIELYEDIALSQNDIEYLYACADDQESQSSTQNIINKKFQAENELITLISEHSELKKQILPFLLKRYRPEFDTRKLKKDEETTNELWNTLFSWHEQADVKFFEGITDFIIYPLNRQLSGESYDTTKSVILSLDRFNNQLIKTKKSDINPFTFSYLYSKILDKLPISLVMYSKVFTFLAQYDDFFVDCAKQEQNECSISQRYLNKVTPNWSSEAHAPILEASLYKKHSISHPSYCADLLLHGLCKAIGKNLNNMLYIGPIREQITRGPILTRHVSNTEWANGSAIWHLVASSDEHTLEEFNKMIHDLGIRYRISLSQPYSNESKKIFSDLEEMMSSGISPEEFQELFKTKSKALEDEHSKVQIKLENIDTGVKTEFKDMGLGISQVLPVVGATVFSEPNALVAIEEPEAHIHPKMQVALGDVFIKSALARENKSSFIIETHSEHLLLRFLRRIRETSEDNLTQDLPRITYNDISVNYIYPKEDGRTVIKHLPITEDGDFATRWPHGFFDERDEELF